MSDALRRPLIGITTDVQDVPQPSVIQKRLATATTYTDAVARAGGVPVLLVPELGLVEHYVRILDGVIFTGGHDIDVRPFGLALHPQAKTMHPQRQAFELALLKALDAKPATPVLGVCLGMQLMGVHKAGAAALIQHMDDGLATASTHRDDLHHAVQPTEQWGRSPLAHLSPASHVASSHHQALSAVGSMRELARSSDGMIEAFDDPSRAFYVGVQWHPERTRDPELGARVIEALVSAAQRSH